MNIWSLGTAHIVGAMATWRGLAPFHRAPLVLGCLEHSTTFLKVLRYVGDSVEGETLTQAEWNALIASNEAMELPESHHAEKNAWLWLFRQRFVPSPRSAVNTLKLKQGFIAAWPGGEDESACLVVETDLRGLREAWASEAADLAKRALRRKNSTQALAAAETAFNLEQVMSPDRVALLARAYDLVGRSVRAEGLVSMAARSMGPEFAQQIQRASIELKGPLAGMKASRGPMLRRAPIFDRNQEAA